MIVEAAFLYGIPNPRIGIPDSAKADSRGQVGGAQNCPQSTF